MIVFTWIRGGYEQVRVEEYRFFSCDCGNFFMLLYSFFCNA